MSNRSSNLPIIIVTGASGLIGRHFLDSFKHNHYIYALARRSQKASGIDFHPNIQWIRVDIGEEENVKRVLNHIASLGGADYFFHFAAYYDFTNKNHPEYERTNVNGTRYLVENINQLHIKRFIFSSSLVVHEFHNRDITITEKSPADANFPYAKSKRQAEEIVRGYSNRFPCTIVRQAAIFSDWCEYQPLYHFLNTWTNNNWQSKIIAGHGETAIPYLHVYELNRFFHSIIKNSEKLNSYEILIASPKNPTSHKTLYENVIKYNYFLSKKPIFFPRWILFFGILATNSLLHIISKKPFERLWMLKYVDKKMIIDNAVTCRKLSCEPTKRFNIERRLVFIIGNMKTNAYLWYYRNELRPYYAILDRKYFKIYEEIVKLKDIIIKKTFDLFTSKKNTHLFSSYQKLEKEKVLYRIEYIYNMLENDIRTGDRTNILNYGKLLAEQRYMEGFSSEEVKRAVQYTGKIIVDELSSVPELKEIEQKIYDEIMTTIQMVADTIEDTYDNLNKKKGTNNI